MKKFATVLTALVALAGLALMTTEASAQRRGGGFGGFRGGGMAFHGGGWRGGGWRGGGWGWGAAAVGIGAGLAAGAAYGYPYYGYSGYYGYPAYGYGGYGACYLTRQWTPYGWQLVQVC